MEIDGKKVASTGTTALGIVGTVLGGTALAGVLGGNGGSPNGGGLLGGLFGGGDNNTCYVTEKEFYILK